MRPPSLEKLQWQCDIWNRHNEVGAAVKVKLDTGEIRDTVTTTKAEILGGHSAVIWLEGVRGCYLLDRVKAA